MKCMPYIEPKDREELDEPIRNLAGYLAGGGYEGRLNYAISSLLCLLLESQGKRYATMNGLVGVLECAKQEFYRKAVAPYEDEKIEQNGDLSWNGVR
jgi:hypothetical protein